MIGVVSGLQKYARKISEGTMKLGDWIGAITSGLIGGVVGAAIGTGFAIVSPLAQMPKTFINRLKGKKAVMLVNDKPFESNGMKGIRSILRGLTGLIYFTMGYDFEIVNVEFNESDLSGTKKEKEDQIANIINSKIKEINNDKNVDTVILGFHGNSDGTIALYSDQAKRNRDAKKVDISKLNKFASHIKYVIVSTCYATLEEPKIYRPKEKKSMGNKQYYQNTFGTDRTLFTYGRDSSGSGYESADFLYVANMYYSPNKLWKVPTPE